MMCIHEEHYLGETVVAASDGECTEIQHNMTVEHLRGVAGSRLLCDRCMPALTDDVLLDIGDAGQRLTTMRCRELQLLSDFVAKGIELA